MATSSKETGQESCPRCKVGVLYLVSDQEDSYGVRCFACDYHESRVKEGYHVPAPGEPIEKLATDAKTKGGES